ncbi:MAG: hypothetical protein DMF06_03430 [Verrucomicrobia bacterium]|nr:MAG: hypothetical protein DMF06_03430 [Verrucomicrobiota bacterium]
MAQSDVLVSGAFIYIAPEDTNPPDETTVSAGEDWAGAWDYMGLTLAPLTLNVNTTEFNVDVQQLSTPILSAITAEELTLQTTLAELTAENLQLVFGGNITTTPAGAAQAGYKELKAGGRTQRTVYTLGFEGKTPLASGTLVPVRFFFHRVQISLGGNMNFDKGAATGVPISAKVLSDDAQADDEKLFIFQRITAVQTTSS